MPISKSATKALRQSEKRRKINSAFKTKVKETIKAFLGKPTPEGLDEAYSVLDKAKKRKIYNKNKVSRLKSSLSKKVEKKVDKKTAKKPTEKKAGKKMSSTK